MAKKRHRSSITGRTVTPEEAAADPDTTMAESAVMKWSIDHLAVLFGALSPDVLEKVQEQFSENTDVFPKKNLVESAIRMVLWEKERSPRRLMGTWKMEQRSDEYLQDLHGD